MYNRLSPFLLFTILVFAIPALSQTQPPTPADPLRSSKEVNTLLMLSTFKVSSVPPTSFGTAFIMGRPFDHPDPAHPNRRAYVLVTANHVLSEMPGDLITLYLHAKNKSGDWYDFPLNIKIRNNGSQRWSSSAHADVAVMYVSIPQTEDIWIPTLSTDLLADDKILAEYDIHPGDTLFCLGFPFAKSSFLDFPILRSGKIASYPLTPADKIGTFLLDFPVFKGNSGGPVYMDDEIRVHNENLTHVKFIAGLVSQEVTYDEGFSGQYSAQINRIPLGLAKIVPAHFIKQAVLSLPSPDSTFK